MATSNKILGQSKPAAATPTTLYTAAAQANVNLFAANQDATNPDTIRVAITKSGESLAASNYIAYDMNLAAAATLNLTGLALAVGDFITVYSLNGDVSFNATGIEIS
jgi:hypothetical protein